MGCLYPHSGFLHLPANLHGIVASTAGDGPLCPPVMKAGALPGGAVMGLWVDVGSGTRGTLGRGYGNLVFIIFKKGQYEQNVENRARRSKISKYSLWLNLHCSLPRLSLSSGGRGHGSGAVGSCGLKRNFLFQKNQRIEANMLK